MAEQAPDGTVPVTLLRIHSSRGRPENAFIAVPYQDYWFYIDNGTIPRNGFSRL